MANLQEAGRNDNIHGDEVDTFSRYFDGEPDDDGYEDEWDLDDCCF